MSNSLHFCPAPNRRRPAGDGPATPAGGPRRPCGSSSIPIWTAIATTPAHWRCSTRWPTAAKRRSWPSPPAHCTAGLSRASRPSTATTAGPICPSGPRSVTPSTATPARNTPALVGESAPTRWKANADATGAIEVYRQALAPLKDGSVVIVSVGDLTNIRNLLRSGPDPHSSLAGPDLVRRKVARWGLCMGGRYPAAPRSPRVRQLQDRSRRHAAAFRNPRL